MRDILRLCRLVSGTLVLLFVAAGIPGLGAQTEPVSSAATRPMPDNLSQAELQEAYKNLHDQLRATQAAIVNGRFDAEAAARAQAAAIAGKIDAMNTTLATERSARQAEADRFEFERGQQQADLNRTNRSVIWIACAFGLLGLLAMAGAAYFQWRAITRVADVMNRQAFPPPTDYPMLPASGDLAARQPLALSTQRLMSTMERMEKRIKELEHTALQSPPASENPPVAPAKPASLPSDAIA